jgi:hypothetical protein
MPSALDSKTRKRARKLRRDGKSLKDIQQELGISYGSAQRFTKGVCPEKERSPAVRAKISAVKDVAHEEWVRNVARGECGTATCDRPGCRVPFGKCHGCGKDAPIAADDDRTRGYVRGEPRRYCSRCQNGGETLMVANNGEPLLAALESAGLTRIEVSRRAKVGKGIVADLIGLEGYRLHRKHCERIIAVLREAFEEKGLDPAEVALESLFTYDRPADEPPVGQRARRTERRRDPIPPNQRGDGRHFKEAKERAEHELAGKGWTREQTAAFLWRAPSIVNARVDQGRLPEPLTVKVGPLRYRVYDERAVKILALDEQKSDDTWVANMRDPDFVFGFTFLRTRDAKAAAQAKARTEERNRRHKGIRVGTGRPKSAGPPSYYHEWAALFDEKRSEMDEWFRERGQEQDRRPSELQVAAAVAEDERGLRHLPDHYHEWDAELGRFVLSPTVEEQAADTVLTAIKRLQIAQTRTRAA